MLVSTATSDVLYTPAFTHGIPCNFMVPSIRAAGFDPAKLSAETAQDALAQIKKPWRDIWAAEIGRAHV